MNPSPPRVDYGQYIGVPFRLRGRDPLKGWDCWGLIHFIFQRHYGVQLESHADLYRRVFGNARLVAHEVHRGGWCPVPSGFEAEGDVVLLNVGGTPAHVGLVIAPYHMIHVEEKISTCIERYDDQLCQQRLEGFYRHPQVKQPRSLQ